MSKELVFDVKVAPLLKEMVAICEIYGIAMMAGFSLPCEGKETVNVSAHTPDENGEFPSNIENALNALYEQDGQCELDDEEKEEEEGDFALLEEFKRGHDSVMVCRAVAEVLRKFTGNASAAEMELLAHLMVEKEAA